MTMDEVRAIHHANVTRSDAPAGWNARQSTRTMVHAQLQAEQPVPGALGHEDPDDAHHKQKMHFRDLWKQADAIVAQALEAS